MKSKYQLAVSSVSVPPTPPVLLMLLDWADNEIAEKKT